MKFCIIGAGSIGLKHSKLLTENSVPNCLVSRRPLPSNAVPTYGSLEEAILSFAPTLVWICSETVEHKNNLLELDRLAFSGKILVEKPLFAGDERPVFAKLATENIFVTYQLRFHSSLMLLKEIFRQERPLTANCYVGQHLSQWRPGRNLHEGYSAYSSRGGGVVRDLSHELDFCHWLFGRPVALQSLVANLGVLGIQAEESAQILYRSTLQTHVLIELNYLDQKTKRSLIVQTSQNSYSLDLLTGKLEKNGADISPAFVPMSQTQVEHIKKNDFSHFCTYAEGLEVMNTIALIEKNNFSPVKETNNV